MSVPVTIVLAVLTLLSVALLLWQFVAARKFPLHQRTAQRGFTPDVTILKPLKGATEHTRQCLESWFTQKYAGNIQLLFGVADENDPVCAIVEHLLREHSNVDAELVLAGESLGPNAKVSTLVQLARLAKHPIICVSDADVRVPQDFLVNAAAPLSDGNVGLVNCFYQLANPTTFAMKWEAIAVNADFWSQVLQSNSMKRQDFALGAAMLTRRETLAKIGGFESLLEFLADDYELGHRIAATGSHIVLSPIVVECWDKEMNFAAAWKHQLRWARTIRACQPIPYFFSLLSNVTLWALLFGAFGYLGKIPPNSSIYNDQAPDWLALGEFYQVSISVLLATAIIAARCWIATLLALKLTRDRDILGYWWLVPIKDLLQFGIWLATFFGNKVEWAGRKFRVERGGRLKPL